MPERSDTQFQVEMGKNDDMRSFSLLLIDIFAILNAELNDSTPADKLYK
jgi:hypothetical protein